MFIVLLTFSYIISFIAIQLASDLEYITSFTLSNARIP
jgi:hypothetical protein